MADGETEYERLIRELEVQISHLVRSNKELEEFLQENGEQKELRVAIGENIVTIARRRAMMEDLQRQAGLLPPVASVMQPASDGHTAVPLLPPPAPQVQPPPPAIAKAQDGDDVLMGVEDSGVYL